MKTEVAKKADFSEIRYAQCWEDADILLEALDIQRGDTCLAIASAGDNALSMLSKSPARVIALDLSQSQLACLELRVAAYRELTHPELLLLMGSRVSNGFSNGCNGYSAELQVTDVTDIADRWRTPVIGGGSPPPQLRNELYQRCRPYLSPEVRQFWDDRPNDISRGIGSAGKFERYFATFRDRLLPLIHHRDLVSQLLAGGSLDEREAFYRQKWDSWRWRLLFRFFFSRFVMGRLGRDPSFFQYVHGSVADRILERTRYAFIKLNPAENPYLQWILTGYHPTALPYALRPENFDAIRANLARLEWYCCSVEEFLDRVGEGAIHRYNLSDIFEYMSPDNYYQLLELIARKGATGGRIAYWNMLAPRQRPDYMADKLRSLPDLSLYLHFQDKAFFYSAFIVEEIL